MRGDAGFPVRLRFSKRGKVRFISHRDVARAFERAFRVEQLPLAFTRGFVPRPKVSFGLALPVGYESEAEYLDVELVEPVDLDAWPETLSEATPDGMDVTGVVALADRAPALQESVTATAYRLDVVSTRDDSPPTEAAVTALVARTMASPVLEARRSRKGRPVVEDVRPALRQMSVVGASEHGVVIELEVATRPRGARPGEVLAAMGGGLADRLVLRTHQWIERGGARLEPLEADPRPCAVEAHAS
jgi:radical SAM-linked protein